MAKSHHHALHSTVHHVWKADDKGKDSAEGYKLNKHGAGNWENGC
jgi:hypothetical protein